MLKKVGFFIVLSCVVFSCDNTKKEEQKQEEKKAEQPSELDEINEQIANNPGSSNGFYRRAKYYAKQGDLTNATDDINRALLIDPEVDFLNLEKARILLSQERISDAILYAQKSIEFNPKYFDGHVLLGKLYYINGEYDEAFKHLDESLRLDQYKAEPYFVKGMLFETLKDSIKAATSFQTAIEQDPNYFDAYYKLAALYYERKPDLAIQYLQRAHDIDTSNIHTLRVLGNAFLDKNDFEQAVLYFNKILQINAGYSEAYFFLGKAYINIYDEKANQYTKDTTLSKSIEYFDKAIELYPDYVQAYYLRGACYQEKGENSKAIRDYQKSLEIDPQYHIATEALREMDK
ncbi:MAG: tetratricopeptide repeat protein [Bacteroidia bacterium]